MGHDYHFCIEYLNYLNSYLDKRKAMFPAEKTVLSADIIEIKNKIKLNLKFFKARDWESVYFLKFIFENCHLLEIFWHFYELYV